MSVSNTEVFPSALALGAEATGSAPGSLSLRGWTTPCTFCMRALRARARNGRVPSGDILAEVQGLADAGVVEVTLLGQNVNTYGRDVSVPRLLAAPAVRGAAACGRRRLGDPPRAVHLAASPRLHPDVIEAMAETPTVCEHIHFPLQSGSDGS